METHRCEKDDKNVYRREISRQKMTITESHDINTNSAKHSLSLSRLNGGNSVLKPMVPRAQKLIAPFAYQPVR